MAKNGSKWPILVILQVFPSFPPNEAQIDLAWPISPDSQLFPSFTTKVSHFWRHLKNMSPGGGVEHQQMFEFSTFQIISHQSGSKWPTMVNFAKISGLDCSKWPILVICRFFHLFPQNEAQIDLEWPISPDSHFPHLCHQSISFWRNLKNFHSMGRGTPANFLSFSTFSNHFTLKWLKVTHNGEFCQNKWLQIGSKWPIFVILQVFPSFPPKCGSDWLGMADFTCITTFPIFYQQGLSFLEPSQNFMSLRGEWGYIGIFFEFFKTDENIKYLKQLNLDWQWQILPKKWLRLAPNRQFWSFCRFFHLFPQNEAQIDLEWPISPDSQLFPSFTTKVSHFWRNLKKNHSCSWGYISNFFEFFNFFANYFTLRVAQNDPQWQILPNKWLRLAQNSQFWSFCRFFHLFPQNQAQIDLEWLITWFTTFPIFCH